MTFNEWLEKWNGHYIDFDGIYGNQCMDLMHQYCVEVLGITDGSVLAAPGAKDVYNNFENIKGHELFEKIPNTPTGVPQEGDILFWGTGTWGHVAIFIEGDASRFRSFDQNYPTGSFCHAQEHSYSGILGWLRCKGSMVQLDAKTFENLVRKSTIYDKVYQKLGVADGETIVLAEIDKLIGYEDKVREQEKQLAEVQAKANEFATQAADKAQELVNLRQEMNELKEKLDSAIKDNLELSRAVQELKTQAQVQSTKPWWEVLFDSIFGKR